MRLLRRATRRRFGRITPLAVLALLMALAPGASAQTPPAGSDKTGEVTDLVNALLGSLMGGAEVTGASLQAEVAEAGGVPFKRDVPLAFIGREELARYLKELFDSEYPTGRARSDERLLLAFDLLPPRHRPARAARAAAGGEHRRLLRRAVRTAGGCTR